MFSKLIFIVVLLIYSNSIAETFKMQVPDSRVLMVMKDTSKNDNKNIIVWSAECKYIQSKSITIECFKL